MTLYVQTRSVVFYDKKGVPQVYSPHFFFPIIYLPHWQFHRTRLVHVLTRIKIIDLFSLQIICALVTFPTLKFIS